MPEQTSIPERTISHSLIRVSVVIIGIIVVGAALAYVFQDNIKGLLAARNPTVVAAENLVNTNSGYTEGLASLGGGDFKAAIPLLQSALSKTTDPREVNIIHSRLAYAYEVTGDYRNAVAYLKKVASSPESSSLVRATSIQQMGLMYYNSLKRPEITEAVFSGPPYDSMYKKGHVNLAYRKLFEYAAEIHPLPFSEFSIAFWYASRLSSIKASTTTSPGATSDLVNRYMQEISAGVSAGESGLKDLIGPESRYDLIAALERRAVLFAALDEAEEGSIGDTDIAFAELFDAYRRVSPSWDAVPRIEYAVHLAKKYGDARAADIKAALAPVYAGNEMVENATLQTILRTSSARESRYRLNFIKLAAIDPQFKSLLTSFGWKETDFGG